MRTKEEVLNSYIFFDNQSSNKSSIDIQTCILLQAMQEYAEEYHQSELLKLNKSAVMNSKNYPVCVDCKYESCKTWGQCLKGRII